MSGSNLTRTALLFASLSLAGSAALAAPASPFVAMEGTWSGGGVREHLGRTTGAAALPRLV